MPGHWNYNAENHLPTHTLTHYTKARGEDFAVLVLWLHEPNYQFQCVFSLCVCVCVCECVCACLQAGASADPDSQISCTAGCATNRHTLSWSRRDDWPRGSSRKLSQTQ